MKPSLEDERRALLEQIEASRSVYKRMLSGESASSATQGLPHGGVAPRHGRGAGAAERALQWATAHPLWVAGGVALMVLIIPRVVSARRRTRMKSAQRYEQRHDQQRGLRETGTLRALLTTAVLLLRDPARLRAVAGIAQSAWRWMQRRRSTFVETRSPGIRTNRIQ